ncbi:MAG: right-handed parallel beta-helix repeat-containing protein [Endomicrobium sp.]|nr:right-handed parallel beta-helix repeat-containing protein [Endomicrobium sp.]
MKKVILLLLLISVFCVSVSLSKALPSAGDLTAGANYAPDNNYDSYIDLVLPVAGNNTSFIFLAPRASVTGKSIFESAENEFNIGVGYRKFLQNFAGGSIIGVNAYYDARKSLLSNDYNQAGAGLEFLSNYVDFRLNGYLPFGNDGRFLEKIYNVFENHNIAASYYYEIAMRGFDSELGFKLPIPKILGALRLFGGYYYFESKTIDRIYSGFKARAEYKPIKFLTLTYSFYQDEQLLGASWQAGAALSFPFDLRTLLQAKNPFEKTVLTSNNVKDRMGEIVQRDMHVRVYQERQKRFDDVVLDEDEEPYYFTVVSPNGLGDGTFANPASLQNGVELSKEVSANTAVLFFLDGVYNQSQTLDLSGHQAKNVLLAGAQELLYREIDVSAISNQTPIIVVTAPDITLFKADNWQAGNWTVAAIEFEGNAKTGTAFEISNSSGTVEFNNNSFTNFGAGIKIINSQTPVSAYNNIISSNAVGIHIFGGSAVLEQNILSQNSNAAVFAENSNAAEILSNKIVSNNIGVKISGAQNTHISNNELTDNGLYGVSSFNSIDTAIDANIINFNGASGIFSQQDLKMQILSNQIESNFTDGIEIINSSGSYVSLNVLQLNGANGINAVQYNYGNIINNAFASNAAAGIEINGAQYLEISDNDVNSNGTFGVSLSGALEAIAISNNIEGNAANAINVTLSQRIFIEGNNIINNTGNGIFADSVGQFYVNSNTVLQNRQNGVLLQNSSNVFVYDNTASENETGIYMFNVSTFSIQDNSFLNSGNFGIYASSVSCGDWTNNRIEDNLNDGAMFSNVKNTVFSENIFAFNAGRGVVFNGVYESTFSANRITTNDSDGIYLSNAQNSLISGNTVDRNKGNAIIYQQGGGVQINANNIYYNEQTGIIIHGSNISVSNNIIYANNEGIRAENVSNIKLFNNDISSSGAGGIYLSNISVSSVSNNTVYENGGYGGIYASNLSEILLYNNYVNNNSNTGITVINADNSTLQGNISDDNLGSGGIYIEGLTNSSVYDNSMHNNLGYAMTLKNTSNLNVNFNGFFYTSTGGGLSIINSSNVLLTTNIFQGYEASSFYGLYLKDTITFDAGSGDNQYLNSNYGGDGAAVLTYETEVKPNDHF